MIENDELVVVPMSKLVQTIQDTVNDTMEKWLDKKIQQEREDRENEEATLTIKQLCEQYHISRPTVYARIDSGVLHPHRIGKRLLFIKRDVLEAFESGKMEKNAKSHS